MSNLSKFLEGVVEVAKGLSYGATINQWSNLNDADAFSSIEIFVRNASVEQIDEMDQLLLFQASANFNQHTRTKLIKMYTFFKIIEINRFGQWRGFPRVD